MIFLLSNNMQSTNSYKSIQLYCDGASKGNPGPAGAGAVAYLDNKILFEIHKDLGIQTNNYAEYSALIIGIQEILKYIPDTNNYNLDVFLDSELVVKQIRGDYKIKNNILKNLNENVMKLLNHFYSYNIQHIPREKNKKADELASKNLKKI